MTLQKEKKWAYQYENKYHTWFAITNRPPTIKVGIRGSLDSCHIRRQRVGGGIYLLAFSFMTRISQLSLPFPGYFPSYF